MHFIQNVSYTNITNGSHMDPGINSCLIQIVDPSMEFPTPLYKFKEIHQFKFLDIEETSLGSPTQEHARKLVEILKNAKENQMTVIVHCVAGICRSGAVTEVGVMMGFEDTKTHRQPNLLLKKLMMKELGWTYD